LFLELFRPAGIFGRVCSPLPLLAAAGGAAALPAAPMTAPPPALVAPRPGQTLSAAERALAGRVSVQTIQQVTRALAAPTMEGRGTGQPGGDRAARYIAAQFKRLGLKPLGDKPNTYLQSIPFRTTTVLPTTTLKAGETTLTLGKEWAFAPPLPAGSKTDVSGELVFVNYGVVSTALGRDDLDGLDLKGKIVVLLTGRPKNVDPEAWKKGGRPWPSRRA
jgi:hypothetical protein